MSNPLIDDQWFLELKFTSQNSRPKWMSRYNKRRVEIATEKGLNVTLEGQSNLRRGEAERGRARGKRCRRRDPGFLLRPVVDGRRDAGEGRGSPVGETIKSCFGDPCSSIRTNVFIWIYGVKG